jgi:uncharacterized protein DUF5330
MMFLLRTTFWVSVGLALLPSFVPKQGSTVPPPVGTADAVTAASEAVADLGGFCERRPDACAAGVQFANAFGQRAQAGAKIVYDFIGERLAKPELVKSELVKSEAGKSEPASPAGVIRTSAHSGAGAIAAEPASGEAAKPSQHTLNGTDMVPAWRGPPHRKDAPSKRTS